MYGAAGGDASFRPDQRGDGDRLIASHLMTLIEHVEENIRLIESAIAGETSPGNPDAVAESSWTKSPWTKSSSWMTSRLAMPKPTRH
jgi:hypothetical protein